MELIDLINLSGQFYNFSISNDLTQILGTSAAASEFCEWVRVEIDVYILDRKYQVKPRSSPWFSPSCAAAIVHRNHFFCLYQKEKLVQKVPKGSDRLVIVAKGFLKLPNLLMPIKQKSSSLPRNLSLGTFGELPIVFSAKVNLLYLLYTTARRCFILHLIKKNCLLKTFLRTLILMTQLFLYLFSLLELT